MVASGNKLRAAVLMGGVSSERNVSLSTGKQILESLDPDRYDAFGVDAALLPGGARGCLRNSEYEVDAIAAARDAVLGSWGLASVEEMLGIGTHRRPDVVIIALHGRFGEDGSVQGMLDLFGIPYTGSGVLASALAMDKSVAKKMLAADGVPVPPSVDFVCRAGEWDVDAVARAVERLGYPVIVKPSRQGSTIGMTKVNASGGLNDAIREAVRHDDRIVVERFIDGVELTVGVLGNDEPFALPVIEIVPEKGFYDYQAKYTPGATQEIVPARIGKQAEARAREIALAAHASLGCRGMSRTDIIYAPSPESDGGAHMYVLEVNTIPGMTPTSLLPTAAAAAGIEFPRLLDMLIDYALEEGERK